MECHEDSREGIYNAVKSTKGHEGREEDEKLRVSFFHVEIFSNSCSKSPNDFI
jgi:hypothetical protein